MVQPTKLINGNLKQNKSKKFTCSRRTKPKTMLGSALCKYKHGYVPN